ncbi:MAG: ABC transporter ATP-binding protein [Anaerolineales bacterium]|nr:ABC transporter ATP-binding protein [Anaerolineales bacterium]
MSANEVVLEARHITKRFPGVLANDHVNLKLYKGEILALLGENGAGKSTLMNILYGLYHQDEGEIFVRGRPVKFSGPRDAIARGIGMVHQHFQLIPVMTVAENIMLGEEVTRFGEVLDEDEAERRVRELSQQYGLEVDPHAIVEELPVGMQQRVEIVKALYRNADILILDEPTAVLTPQESEELFRVMRDLAARGVSIIFISHKLKEVLSVAHRIMVMRDGRVVGETTPAEATEATLAAMMVGRDVILQVPKGAAHPGEPVLRVIGLSALDDRKHQAVNNVSFEVRAGEILGIAGVQGNGQTELVEVLTGLRTPTAGRIIIGNIELNHATPRDFTLAGIAHIPEDRHRYGMVLQYTVADNMVLNTYFQPPYAHGLQLNFAAVAEHAKKLVKAFDVRTPSIATRAGALSGGNQQKVVVAREVSRPIRLLIASQPTRGLDVGSIEYIHRQIVAKRDAGCAVLLVSAELDEIMALSDRIAVMYKGQILATLDAAQATREQLGLLMAGITQETVG